MAHMKKISMPPWFENAPPWSKKREVPWPWGTPISRMHDGLDFFKFTVKLIYKGVMRARFRKPPCKPYIVYNNCLKIRNYHLMTYKNMWKYHAPFTLGRNESKMGLRKIEDSSIQDIILADIRALWLTLMWITYQHHILIPFKSTHCTILHHILRRENRNSLYFYFFKSPYPT